MKSEKSPFKVAPGTFNKSLVVPTSKSYANRMLVLASVFNRPIELTHIPESTDVKTMIACLKKIGLEIEETKNGLRVNNSFPECEGQEVKPLALESGDGGTTNRFIIALLARGKRTYHLNASGHMRNRPMEEMLHLLEKLGVEVIVGKDNDDFWISVKGPMKTGENKIEVDCGKTTQFATGLSLALADKNVSVIPVNMENSEAYFKMTENLNSLFKNKENTYEIPVDFSSLSYPLALGLTLGEINVSNCKNRDEFQADSIFLEIIEKMGGKLLWNKQGLTLKEVNELKPIDINCSGFPDLVPTLAYACSCASGTSKLRNLGVLRHKESDRVEEILNILKLFQITYQYDKKTETLSITGTDKKSPSVDYNPPDDHRMIMTAYMFMRRHSGGTISNYHHVAKSYPNFFKSME